MNTRRAISLVLVALLFTACSKAVEVPRPQFEAASRDESARHRITTKQGDVYLADRFSLAGTTITIEVLAPNDASHAQLPLTLSLGNVTSIKRIENGPPLYVIGIGVVAFIGVVALLTEGDGFTD